MTDLSPEQQLELKRKFAKIYLEADKPLVVKYIKGFIKHNGYINTRYACWKAVPEKTFEDNGHRDAFFESVSAMLVNTGKYTREPNKNPDKGYNILLNPAYFNNKSVRIIAILALAISIAGVATNIISNSGNKGHTQEQTSLEQQRLQLDKQIQSNVLQMTQMIGRKNPGMDSTKPEK